MEKFSVLMSVYHREKGEFLRTSLASVFEQTVEPNEVVLVKDGPLTGELDAVIAEFSNKYDTLKVVALPQNVGLGNALNEGLKHCSNGLVARMDSDDICMPNRFEEQLKAFKNQADLTVVGSCISEFENDPNVIISYRKLPETNIEIQTFFKSKCPLNHVTVMFRKDAVISAGGYEHFYLLEDYWLWARMIKNGTKIYNVQQNLVNVRGGAAMVARRGGWKYAKSEVKLQYRFYKLGLIGLFTMVKNVAIRFTVRMMPTTFRNFIYKKILR